MSPPHRPQPDGRDAYRHFTPLATRWMDNDAYGHLNNVVYYSLFDTAVNRYLIEAGALDRRPSHRSSARSEASNSGATRQ